jgi:hypothetical protein
MTLVTETVVTLSLSDVNVAFYLSHYSFLSP